VVIIVTGVMHTADHDSGRSRRIIVAEADEAIRNSLQFALRAEGYDVSVFADGTALLAAPDAAGADAYILDHQLPDMDGIHLLSRLRATRASGPALFLAGRATPAFRRSAAALGATVLDKPLIGDALNAGLRDLLVGGESSPDGVDPDLDQGARSGPA
jgi:DNA-binding response OmpR family regulator